MASDSQSDSTWGESITVLPNPSPSSFTAVNGQTSPTTQSHQPSSEAVAAAAAAAAAVAAAATTTTAEASSKPSPLPLDRPAASINGNSDHKSQPASLTTSPSLVDSTATGGRQEESPVSPQSVMTEPTGRKRSYDGAFGNQPGETHKQSTVKAEQQQQQQQQQQLPLPQPLQNQAQQEQHVTLPPMTEQLPRPSSQPPHPHDHHRQEASRDFERSLDRHWAQEGQDRAQLPPPPPMDGSTAGPPPRQQPLSSDYDPLARPDQDSGYYDAHEEDQTMSDPGQAESENADDSKDGGFASPDHDEQHPRPFGEYSRTASGVQVDPEARNKRRKRVFSNRTKTGCMTCRKRKKKCDEAHPECNNCLRGGFVCEGYSQRSAWPKPAQAKAPVLQSKPASGGTSASASAGGGPPPYTPTQPSPHSVYGQHQHPSAPSSHRGSDAHAAVPPDLKPIEELHRRDSHRISPPTDSRSAGQHSPWSHYAAAAAATVAAQQQQQHHSPHYSERAPPHDPRDSHHDIISAAEHVAPPPPPPPHHQPLYTMAPTQPPVHHGQHGSLPRIPPPQTNQGPPILPGIGGVDTSSSSALTRRPSSADTQGRSNERDKMLRGEYYLPYTPALMADREQCAAATWRFNNAANPAHGFTHEARMALFAQIVGLRPTSDPREAPLEAMPVGSVGPGTIVEAPFNCDYGYNISIGRDVIIGAECRINDTCQVVIGDNVVFSPGVKLVCGTYAIDPKERKKGKGRALGRNIVIEDDAWLGAGVTILPGVRVGRCCTVGAGSLLHKDVPPYTVVAGNPPKVIRGIYDETTR